MSQQLNGILEVERRLRHWAAYMVILHKGEIGWASRNIIVSISEGRGARFPTTGTCPIAKYEHSQLIDSWIKSMGREYPNLEDALNFYYTCKLPVKDVAYLLGVSKSVLYQRINEAKIWLCGRLNAHIELIEKEMEKQAFLDLPKAWQLKLKT